MGHNFYFMYAKLERKEKAKFNENFRSKLKITKQRGKFLLHLYEKHVYFV